MGKPDWMKQGHGPSVCLLAELVEHSLRPGLLAQGADVWLDEVRADHLVLGFRADRAPRDRIREWLLAALVAVWPDAPSHIELRDYSEVPLP